MDITIKPLVTEKATAYSEKLNCYTFAVSPNANKFQIKDIVEKLYNVRVESVLVFKILLTEVGLAVEGDRKSVV